MAIYGTLATDNILSIDASIADNAVDIFVYDTRKDSDGGAWRKTCQHTSWYNETLNTATRGSRREFPAVAVIVAESNQVTIYDGDDPDLPMWMVFNGLSYQYMIRSGTNCISALNGILCVGNVSNLGLIRIEFIADRSKLSHSSGDAQRYFKGNISQRNSTNDYDYGYPALWDPIVNGNVNDVAMTVLPNAPIDETTGLPIPTIAVATNGGVSVIRDDGQVFDLTFSGQNGSKVWKITFDDKHQICMLLGYSNIYPYTSYIYHVPSSDTVLSAVTDRVLNNSTYNFPSDAYGAANTSSGDINDYIDSKYFGTDKGMSFLTPNKNDIGGQLICHINTKFNSGWQHGNIKGAFLADTDGTSASSSSLISGNNSTFDTGTGNWSAPYQSTIAAVNGQLEMTATGSNPYATLFVTGLVIGRQYRVDLQSISSNFSSGLIVYYGNDGGLYRTQYGSNNITTPNKYEKYFTATTTSLNIQVVGSGSVGQVGVIDNVFLYELEEDRSVNAKGLQVFGTITKSPVTTGAELVGYGPFSSSNYLVQPYNSALDFGTGDYYFTYWMKSPIISSDQAIFQQGDYSLDKGIFTLVWNSGGSGNSLQVGDGGGNIVIEGHESEGWIQIFVTRQNGVISAYKNSRLMGTVTSTKNINYSSSGLGMVIGNMTQGGSTGSFPYGGSLALFRVGASAPSPEQIRKIYEDEKVLFQENAACTLYGSSDAVTALAYDEDTELLHVGTSSGRSEFKGLRRVGNTTTAVTTAISASNGLVAEQ